MSTGRARVAALIRMATGLLFLALGYSKMTGEFVRGGFGEAAAGAARKAWPFWRPVLEGVIVPNADPLGWVFAGAEVAIGIGLLLGLMTPVAAAGGVVLMLGLVLNDSYAGPGAAWTEWVTAALSAKLALLLFALILASDAGRVWGIDGRLKRGRPGSRLR